MTRSKVAAKYVSLVDLVEDAPRQSVPVPAIVRQVRPTVPQHRVHALVRALKLEFGFEFEEMRSSDLINR